MTKSDRLVTHILCYETIQCSSDHIRGSDVPFTKIKWYPASAWLKRTYNTMEDFVLQWYNKEVAATMNTKILGDFLIAGMPSTPKKNVMFHRQVCIPRFPSSITRYTMTGTTSGYGSSTQWLLFWESLCVEYRIIYVESMIISYQNTITISSAHRKWSTQIPLVI